MSVGAVFPINHYHFEMETNRTASLSTLKQQTNKQHHIDITEQTNSTMDTTVLNTPGKGDRDPVLCRIRGLLDKRPDGEIQLDWNAFEPSTVVKETELKDIHKRLCPDLDYGTIRMELRDTVTAKRAAMLGMAKDMIFEKILTECQMLQVKTRNGTLVTSKDLLKVFFKTTSNEKIVTEITYTCFKNSPRWKDDMTQNLIECFGINYDPCTITTHRNRKGNGFLEKIITKALNNVRADLRAVQGRASTLLKEPRQEQITREDTCVLNSAEDEFYDAMVSWGIVFANLYRSLNQFILFDVPA
jgi:hypothetical protein